MNLNQMLLVKSPHLAAHLIARGHHMLAVEPEGRPDRFGFYFPLSATEDFNIFRRHLADVYAAIEAARARDAR